MSISTSGGEQRRPSVVSTGKKSPAGGKPAEGGKAAGAKPTEDGKAAGAKPAGTAAKTSSAGRVPANRSGGGGGGKKPQQRRPVAPVRVSQGRSWGSIGLFVAVGVVTAAIIGYGAYAVIQNGKSWEDKAAAIDGITNYRKTDPSLVEPFPGKQSHEAGPLTYKISPPVGSSHNNAWQNCVGDVYDAPIANEHAVHSLEHGAIWITYKSDLPAEQVEQLASKVRGNEFMLMSPIENLDRPISLQAWGYQLKLDSASDGRIDDFVAALRQNASMEPGAPCSGGITATGTTPRDNVQGDQPQAPAGG
ncbi:DUF3105 domain-containing protein [Plantactinospora sp. S1510]|uniref:DUF3105 domain-containing protein n=1 Tax=Plantactinospora alkalitolerans TaxID=2789879 RepID=A0ABS0H5C3_9ACTN|nr:DUF3105 domain-containing protein [Plantactinospora alkalitolerans]MBF9133663.1 DUF3105 domain-containing protein [Plantactinospora alkalitolerans]